MCKQQYISDIINIDDINTWNSEEIIFIEAPTGRGKSHFIKYILSEYNKSKKILMLVNRTIIKNQSGKELLREDTDNITITTYQNIANKIIHKEIVEFGGYDYIICDEAHHFCEESEFCHEGDECFNWVMNQECIKIFMTATANFIKPYLQYELNLKLKHYYISNTYDFIEQLYFYEDDNVIKKLLTDLPPNEKAIYFASAKKAHELSDLLDSCVFYCSKNNYTYSQYSDLKVCEYIEDNEKFEEQILCTTKVMDCGVNIKDVQVKHLIIDIADITSVIQCIGRKRIQVNERIKIYIKDKKGNAIARKLESIKSKLYYANVLKKYGLIKLIEENAHKNTYGNLIYDIINLSTLQIDKKINDLMYYTYSKNEEIYNEIMQDTKNGFKLKLLKRMCIDLDYKYLEDELDALTLEDILNKSVGIKMFKEEQRNFKELLLKQLLNAPKSNHGSIGLKTINALFDENHLNYIMNSKREKSGEFRDKIYWVISKL